MNLRRPERGEKYSNNKALQAALFSFQAHTRTKPNGVSVDVVSLNLFSIIRKREESINKALALWRQGEKEKAREVFKKSLDVTNEMALKVIKVCFSWYKIQYEILRGRQRFLNFVISTVYLCQLTTVLKVIM